MLVFSMAVNRVPSTGDVEELPEGTQQVNANAFRIRPTAYEPESESVSASRRSTWDGEPSNAAVPAVATTSNGTVHAPGKHGLPATRPPLRPPTRPSQCWVVLQGQDSRSGCSAFPLGSAGFEGGDHGQKKGLQFSDKDEHMYFWFPLLAGLSELTFDPRPDIR